MWSLAVCAPIFMFMNMDLRLLVATGHADDFSANEYWITRAATTLCGLLATGLLAQIFTSGATTHVLIAVAFAKAVDSIADLAVGWHYRFEQTDRVAQSYAARGALMLVSIVFGLTVGNSLTFGLLMGAVLNSVWLGLVEWRRIAGITLLDRHKGLSLLRVALPLGVVGGLGSLASGVPRYFLGGCSSDIELTAFGCCASAMQLLTMSGVAAQQAISPRIADHCQTDDAGALKTLRLVAVLTPLLALLACAAAAIAGGTLLGIVYGPDYRAYTGTIVVMVIAASVFAGRGFLATALTANQRTGCQAAIVIASCCVAIALGPVLIPRYGAFGASLVVLATATVSLVLHAAVILADTSDINVARRAAQRSC